MGNNLIKELISEIEKKFNECRADIATLKGKDKSIDNDRLISSNEQQQIVLKSLYNAIRPCRTVEDIKASIKIIHKVIAELAEKYKKECEAYQKEVAKGASEEDLNAHLDYINKIVARHNLLREYRNKLLAVAEKMLTSKLESVEKGGGLVANDTAPVSKPIPESKKPSLVIEEERLVSSKRLIDLNKELNENVKKLRTMPKTSPEYKKIVSEVMLYKLERDRLIEMYRINNPALVDMIETANGLEELYEESITKKPEDDYEVTSEQAEKMFRTLSYQINDMFTNGISSKTFKSLGVDESKFEAELESLMQQRYSLFYGVVNESELENPHKTFEIVPGESKIDLRKGFDVWKREQLASGKEVNMSRKGYRELNQKAREEFKKCLLGIRRSFLDLDQVKTVRGKTYSPDKVQAKLTEAYATLEIAFRSAEKKSLRKFDRDIAKGMEIREAQNNNDDTEAKSL